MRAHVIRDGRVENTIEVESLAFEIPGATLIDAAAGGQIGDSYDAGLGAFTPPASPAPVVSSVLPVAFRRALRATPAPEGSDATDALDFILVALAQPGMEDARDAFEYAVRVERQDALQLAAAMGIPEAALDDVMQRAADYPGSGATYT